MKKLLTGAFLSLCMTPAYAANIEFEAFASFSYQAFAFDAFGNEVAPSFDETGGISAFSQGTRNDVLNTFESIGDSDSLTLTNTSATDVVDGGVAEIFLEILPDTVVAPTFYEVTSFSGLTNDITVSAFAFARGNYTCSAAELADPGIACNGVFDGQTSTFDETGFFQLAPGESLSVGIETAPLLIVNTQVPNVVPLPAGGLLMLSGLFGLGLLRRRKLRQSK